MSGRMFVQRAFARSATDLAKLRIRQLDSGHGVIGRAGDEDLAARCEEPIKAFPPITQDWCATGGSLKQSAGRAVAHLCHGLAGDVPRHASRAVKSRMVAGRQVLDEVDVAGPWKRFRILRTGD